MLCQQLLLLWYSHLHVHRLLRLDSIFYQSHSSWSQNTPSVTQMPNARWPRWDFNLKIYEIKWNQNQRLFVSIHACCFTSNKRKQQKQNYKTLSRSSGHQILTPQLSMEFNTFYIDHKYMSLPLNPVVKALCFSVAARPLYKRWTVLCDIHENTDIKANFPIGSIHTRYTQYNSKHTHWTNSVKMDLFCFV